MKILTILLLLLAPALTVCTDTRPPSDDASSSSMVESGGLAATGDSQDTSQVVVRRVWAKDSASPYGGITPDGRYMTFVSWQRGGDLAVRDMRTGEVRYLTDRAADPADGGYADESMVSRDGKRVAYNWGRWVWDLYIVDLDGSNRKKLREGIDELAFLDWTPDGQELLLGMPTGTGGRIALSLVSASDGSTRILKELDIPGGPAPGAASFSPDGLYLVYTVNVARPDGGFQRDVAILSVENGRDRTLIEDPSDDHVLGWVPGTDYVLFASDRTGSESAWVLEVKEGRAAGPPVLVKNDLWRPAPVGFTAEGAFYYGVKTSVRGAYLATIDPETKRMLSEPTPVRPPPPGGYQRPQWSPDGRYLAYLTSDYPFGSSEGNIAIRSMETGETRYIQAAIDVGSQAPRWSPDGRSILQLGTGEDGFGLFRVDAQTGETRTIKLFTSGDRSFWADWAPDGKTVYYRLDSGEAVLVEALDLDTGGTRVLRSVEAPDWTSSIWVDVSPDGRELAFWERREGVWHLCVIPTSGEELGTAERELLAMGDGFAQVSWSREGRYLMVYLSDEDDSLRLWRVPASGGEPEPLELVFPQGCGPGNTITAPDFNPDGSRIAFDCSGSDWEIWVMENYLPTR